MDIFYDTRNLTLKQVKSILTWGQKRALNINVDMLDCKKSFHRVKADKTFEEVMARIDGGAKSFFRVIKRIQGNAFMIFSDKLLITDWVELFIRNVMINDVEYFLFIYLKPECLGYLEKKYRISV